MFLPDQTKTDFAELLGDEKTLRKLKKTQAATGGKASTFEGGIGDFDIGGSSCGDGSCDIRHGRSDAQRNAAKAISGMAAAKIEKRSYRQMAIGGIMLIALSGGLISTLWTIVDYLAGASLFQFVNVHTEQARVESIFESGDPYVVYCPMTASKALPKMLIDAGNSLPRGFNTVMLNCSAPIKYWNGQSVYQKYDMNERDIPAFVVANGDKPKQFNRNSFYNVDYFVEFVKVQTTPKFREIESQGHFKVACTDKQRCVAIGHKGKLSKESKEAIESANSYFRLQKISTIDTSKYAIKLNDDGLVSSLEKQMSEGKTGKQFLSGLCWAGRVYDPPTAPRGFVRRITESELYTFLKDCVGGGTGLMEVKAVPTLELKSKKDKKKKAASEKKEKAETGGNRVTTPAPQRAAESQYADDGMEIIDDDE